MPVIIEYAAVLKELTGHGMVCNYPNGGSFGFPQNCTRCFRGWIGPPDWTIKRDMRRNTRQIVPPYEANLAELVHRAWLALFPGNLWIMPASHWSFELHHGSGDWLPGLITSLSLDATALAARTDGSAIQFSPEESDRFKTFAESLLKQLHSSDFCIAFPGHPAVCTLHHHQQIWWITRDPALLTRLDALAKLGDIPCE
ncbi:MAG: hypothetical protein ABSF29_03405 [Tepidisphaeraceae bacterium]